ncbi:MAG: hypothetical protein EBX57_08745, partial [Betaproteobacteria bacterium]|nr:hypothetical protein [Betaproteobacteria bacterium]
GLPEDDSIDAYTRKFRPAEGMTVMDVGAHAGLTTYFFSKMVGDTGKVYAFEPDSIAREALHRNIANLFVHSDLNALSTVQFAVERLGVAHVIVVGHYGCSGVLAALEAARIGLADNWLRHIQDVRDRHQAMLDACDASQRHDRLVELNVIEQVRHVGQSTVVLDAWARGHQLCLHGWVYGIGDGLLKDLLISASDPEALNLAYVQALERIARL